MTAWALITNLRMDPYERGLEEGGESMKFLAQNIWLLVPIQGKIKEFFADFDKDERPWLATLIDAIADAAPLLVQGDDGEFMNRCHLALHPPRPKSSHLQS